MKPMATPSKMKVAELREALEKRGLDSAGLKPDLVSRLEAALASGGESGAPAPKPGAEFGDGERGEAEMERQAEIEMTHVPMKAWYQTKVSEANKQVRNGLRGY